MQKNMKITLGSIALQLVTNLQALVTVCVQKCVQAS